MSQLYVPDGALVLCTNGKKPAKIKVRSQYTITIDGGKLAATEADRFDGNFMCLQMLAAGALIGALVGAAVALTGGAALGGILAAAAAGSVTGFTLGKLTSMIPSICSILTCTSQWSVLHEKVFFEKKRALLQHATINCALGGLVSIVMENLVMAYNMSILCQHIYDNKEKPIDMPPGFEQGQTWENEKTGFKARLYKDTITGKNVLVFNGTDTKSLSEFMKDMGDNNIPQGAGFSSEQYKEAVQLERQLSKEGIELEAVAGHSLGGGLAAIAGTDAGVPTYTYNAAGVHPNTFKENKVNPENAKNIQAYSGDSDILTTLQDNREAILGTFGTLTYLLGLNGALPRNQGQRMELETGVSWFPNPIEGHGIEHLVNALKDKAKEQAKATVITEDY